MSVSTLAALLQVSSEPQLLVSSSGELIAINVAAAELLHVTPATLPRPLSDLVSDEPQTLRAFLAACSATSSPLPGALTFRNSQEGESRFAVRGALVQRAEPVVFLVIRIQAEHGPIGRFRALNEKIEELAREVHARRQIEDELRAKHAALQLEQKRLRAVLEVLPAGVWIASADGRIIAINEAAAQIWGGAAPHSETAARYHLEYRGYWPDGRPLGEGEWGLARALAGERCGPEEVIVEDFAGGRKTILNYAMPIVGNEGEVTGAVALSVDITARKEVEEELRRARTQAEEASKVKSAFMATISHELRTPLNAIIGYADLLHAGVPEPLPEGALVQVHRVRLGARHLLQLIEEVLTFSRLEAGRERVHLEEVALEDLLTEVYAVVQPLAVESGLAFTIDSADAPLAMEIDPRKTRQILLNLLGNAVKFTQHGQVTLSVREEGEDVLFTVADTGVGISPEDQDRVFDPFWQADHAMTREKHGTGLGLSISRRYAELLGGEITVVSEPGQGSTFILRLKDCAR